MPITDIIVVCVIISAFAIFALALAWGDIRPGKSPRRVANERPAASMLCRSGRTRRGKIPYALRGERLACRRIKLAQKLLSFSFKMSRVHAHDLARLCTELVRKGNDFPPCGARCSKATHSLMAYRDSITMGPEPC